MSLGAAGIGALGLAGWIFGIDALKRMHPGLVTMKANTALCLVMSGLALASVCRGELARWLRVFATVSATFVATVGFLTLGEQLGWWDAGIDQALFRESLAEAGRSFPGRMNPGSALSFVFAGLAILFLDLPNGRGAWPAQCCALGIIASIAVVFVVYYYNIELPVRLQPHVSIALHTVAAFSLLVVAILVARPGQGFMGVALANDVGGTVARWMLPVALLLPALLGWLCSSALGGALRRYGGGADTALLAVMMTMIFTGLVWRAAKSLSTSDLKRRRAEAELNRREHALSDFFDNAPVGLRWVGPDGRVIRANNAELRLLGFSREEYVGRPIAEFHHDAAVLADIFARLDAGETLANVPARMRCKDGSLRDVLIHSSVYREDGRFVHTRCFTHDVTELRRAEAERDRLASIVASSADAILSKDLQGIVRSWNSGATRLFGYSSGEMIGQPILRIIPPWKQAEEGQILDRLRQGEEIEHYETDRVTMDGSVVHVSLSISPLRDHNGVVIGASTIARDITLRRKAEAELARQQEWFRVTLSSIGDAVVATDPEGVVTFLNPVAEAMTGWTAQDACGRPANEILQLVHDPPRTVAENPLERALRDGVSVGMADFTILVSRDGREIAIDDSAAPIVDRAGKLMGAVMVFQDVTQRRQAAEALERARDDAEAASRAKDDFLAVLSHELRTPLTPALVTVSDLESCATHDPAELRDALALIRRSIELEARLVDDLLDVTRISRGKLGVAADSLDVHLVLRHSLALTESMLSAKRITVVTEFTATHHHVCGDLARLTQVFSNLLANAAKFTSEGGRVTLRTSNDTVGDLRVEVRDNGIGIEPALLPNIFHPFQQAETGASRRFGGLGLGLTIARGLIEAHGGSIEASSSGRNQGACFTIKLPVLESTHPPGERGEEPDPPTSPPTRNLRVLLVEDHVDTRNVLHLLMTRWGHEVTAVGTVGQAREALASATFDLLLSDIGLPDGTGFDVVSTLRQKAATPAVAMTGYGANEDIAKARAAGFSEHITKPIKAQALRDLLDRFA